MATVVKQDVSTLGALNANSTIIDVSDSDFIACQSVGTFVGTVTFHSSNDGVAWHIFAMHPTATTVATADSNGVTGPSTQSKPTNGIKYFKTQMTAYTSGTVTMHTLCTRYGKQI